MKFWNKKIDIFSFICIVIALLVTVFITSAVLAILLGGISHFREAVLSEEVQFAFRMSFLTSGISTILVMLLALPCAYALTRTKMPFQRFSSILIELVLSLPYIILGLSLLIMFSSPFGKWLKMHGIAVVFSPLGIVMAHLMVNLPYAVRLIRTAFEKSDRRLEYIAQTLGASAWDSFRTILLPLSRNEIISTAILTWSRAMGEFGATLMLVGVTRFKTETLTGSIYLSISTGENEVAMATAIIMIMISALTLIVARVLERDAGGRKADSR